MTTVEEVASMQAATADRQAADRQARHWYGTRLFGPLAVVLALLSAGVTFALLTGFTPIVPTNQVVWGALIGNALTGLFLIGVIGWELWKVLQARWRGRAAARLHIQIIGRFSVI